MKLLVAQTLRLVNLRTFLLLTAAYLCLAMPLPAWLDKAQSWLNHAVFRLGMDFSALPSPSSHITVVHVSGVEFDSWMADISGAERLEDLIVKTLEADADKSNVVGIILDKPLTMIQSQAESLLTDIQQGRRTRDHLFEEVSDVLGRRERLTEQLRSPQVVMGVENTLFRGVTGIAIGASSPWLIDTPVWLRQWLWPGPARINLPVVANAVYEYAPLWPEHELPYPLVVEFNGQVIPGFELRYLQAAHAQLPEGQNQNSEPVLSTPPIRWRPAKGFLIGEDVYRSSVFGSMTPLYGSHTSLRSALRQLSLDAALSSESLGGWVLVGRDGSPHVESVAQTIAAMADDAQIVEPLWWSPLQKLILFSLALVACFWLPRFTRYWKTTFWVSTSLLLVLTAFLAQAIYRYWLPVAELLLFMPFALVLISVWRRQSGQRQWLESAWQNSLLKLSDQLSQTGELTKALDTLKPCETSKGVLERYYTLGDALAERNDPVGAIEAFTEIKRRKRLYKDVPSRIKELQKQLSIRKTMTDAQEHPLAQTCALQGLEPNPPTIGRYEIQQELGRGAHGTVFLGYDPKIAREVAVKTLHLQQFKDDELATITSRFHREARAVGRLAHPNIVQIYDMGEEEQLAYITMDYARGHPLSEYVQPDRLLPVVQVYRAVLAVAEALHYAHRQEVIHRDIKPSNIIYQEEPFQVRITDFGIARLVDYSHTATWEILGSPLYMAPELLAGKPATAAADIFSLGVTFYQLLTGALPFYGDNIANLTYAIMHGKHVSVRKCRSDLPASATRITNTALHKKPEQRYTTAADFADALRKALKRDFGINPTD